MFCNGWDDDQVLVDKLITSWENVCRFSVVTGAKIGHNADTRDRLKERIRRAISDIGMSAAGNGARFRLVSFSPEDIVWVAFCDDIQTETAFVIQGRRHALFDEWWQEIRNKADYDYFVSHERPAAPTTGEHRDIEEEWLVEQADGTVIVDARLPVEDLEERFGIEVERDKFDTVAGLIFHLIGRIPEMGEEVLSPPLILTILEADQRKIRKVRIVEQEKHPQISAESA